MGGLARKRARLAEGTNIKNTRRLASNRRGAIPNAGASLGPGSHGSHTHTSAKSLGNLKRDEINLIDATCCGANGLAE